MGKPYESWARYYDRIYKGMTDYAGDVAFLETIFRRYARGPVASILDLGCGTGTHGLLLLRQGHRVLGVDASRAMIQMARAKAREEGLPLELRIGDMRSFRTPRVFDAVICMFNAFGYLTSSADIRAGLGTARKHLRPGGLFIFEFWNTAQVIPGHQSWIEVPLDGETLIRLSQASLDSRRPILKITFKFYVIKDDKLVDRFESVDPSRTYSPGEMRALLGREGFSVETLIGVEPKRKVLGTPTRGYFRNMAVARLRGRPPMAVALRPPEPQGKVARAKT